MDILSNCSWLAWAGEIEWCVKKRTVSKISSLYSFAFISKSPDIQDWNIWLFKDVSFIYTIYFPAVHNHGLTLIKFGRLWKGIRKDIFFQMLVWVRSWKCFINCSHNSFRNNLHFSQFAHPDPADQTISMFFLSPF